MNIREATLYDVPCMQYINQVCLTENYPIAFWVKGIVGSPKASFVAVNESGLIVGYILTEVLQNNAHICSFAIYPKYRSLGIGKQLIETCIQSCFQNYKIEHVSLNVRVQNDIALNLYKKVGFEIITRTPKYYNNGEDAYLMSYRKPSY